MAFSELVERNLQEIRRGGLIVFVAKLKKALCQVLPALLIAIFIRVIRPICLVRIGTLISSRLGHFAGNTELYLCERDAGINAPQRRYIDIFVSQNVVCNKYLMTMWRRIIPVFSGSIMRSLFWVNRLIPGSADHCANTTLNDRDIHNLLDRFPPHLEFTEAEEIQGRSGLKALGISDDAKFICLIVRDSEYLSSELPSQNWNYHSYRDCNIQNYALAAEELANRGYFVVRMGANVKAPLSSSNSKIIDYALSGMRSDFLDIYLGAKCTFCITTGCGWDAVPSYLFRRPLLLTNIIPIGLLSTWSEKDLQTTKRLIRASDNTELTVPEIFELSLGFSIDASDYQNKGIRLVENSPEELRDATIEMVERIEGTWAAQPADENLQREFWQLFRTYAIDQSKQPPVHGELRARFGATYLRENRHWFQ